MFYVFVFRYILVLKTTLIYLLVFMLFHVLKKYNLAWKEKKVNIIEITASGKYPLTRMMNLTILGDLVSIELAKLNGIDPTPVEIIENLKIELSK